MSSNPLDIEVGGTHYKKLPFQPVTLITRLKLNFIQGSIVKYISRFRYKNGKEDLEKVLHYVDLGIALNPDNFFTVNDYSMQNIDEYIRENDFTELIRDIIWCTSLQYWNKVKNHVEQLITQVYGTVH